jgi:ribosomal protein S18 acetylase RimI-like enzyme
MARSRSSTGRWRPFSSSRRTRRGPYVEIRLLGPDDVDLLTRVAPGVFDYDVDPDLTEQFLRDDRHHLVAAIDSGLVVGFVSGVHYVHPDKPSELWINEVAVAPSHHRRGIGQQMLRAIFRTGRDLGCGEAWVLTNRSNTAAMKLYASVDGTEDPEDTVMFTFRLPHAASPAAPSHEKGADE